MDTRGFRRAARAFAAVLVLLVTFMVPTVGSAGHGEFCRVQYSQSDPQSRSCGINFYGPPLTLYADACSADCKTGTVSVSATMSINNGTVILLQCSSTGIGFASCNDDLSVGEAVSTVIGTFPVTCRVSGGKSGEISCASGCAGPGTGIECEILATPLPTPS
jgi:hypothetical protein